MISDGDESTHRADEVAIENDRKRKNQFICFVSYNGNDKAWAEWIAWTIEDSGHRALLQAWDFLPGCTWPQQMHRFIIESDKVICVVSPDFLESDFAAAEWQAVFVDDPIGDRRRLLPIRVRDCKPHGLLGTRVYVDLVNKNRHEARALLRAALSGSRAKPQSEPEFPGESGSQEPDFPGCIHFALVLDGTFEGVSRGRVEAIVAHLRKLLNDPNVTITEVRPGSVILSITCAARTFRSFSELLRRGEILDLEGMRIIGYWSLSGPLVDPVEDRLSQLMVWLPQVFSPFVSDQDEAKDLTQDFLLKVFESDELRYSILGNPAKAGELAEALMAANIAAKETDRAVRARVKKSHGGIARTQILQTALSIYDELDDREKKILEAYWAAVSEGGVAAELLDEHVRAAQIKLRKRLKG
jgi:hypothetical protein